MTTIAPADRSQLYRAFMEAFADYAMDASGTREETLWLRMAKNSVDWALSPGAYDGERLVGFTLIGVDRLDDRLTAYDAGTGIIPAFRGQGLAKRMFDSALPGLRARGVERFLLEVLQSNEQAIRAYEKSGFTLVRDLRCYTVQREQLLALPDSAGVQIRRVDGAVWSQLLPEADWTPSFENRFSVPRAIPDHIQFLGAYRGQECVGALSYCSDLNWLLSLLIRRDHRRQGVGTALLRAVEPLLPAAASRLAALNIDGADSGMQAFFDAIGFRHLVDQYEMALDL